ncbi:MAG: polyphosphate kinase 1 [Candidatus Promineofilum sp.]|nr:polyphosphate kinase 1 [Promineifilum sp.]MCW5865172.1 polyphosphate kinase 1 [Anaerolineae bacterium]
MTDAPPPTDTVQEKPAKRRAPAPEKPPVIDLRDPSLYINRELSNIEFNRRVLHETQAEHPLLERTKFLAIFQSNMDEFFMVRVSGLKQQLRLGVTATQADGLLPREQLANVHRTLTQLFSEANAIWRDQLHPQLAEANVHVLNYEELSKGQRNKLRAYFEREIFPVLTPLASDPSRPFPHISNLSLNLAVQVRDPKTGDLHFARVKVPPALPRLVPLKRFDPDQLSTPAVQKFVWAEQVIAANLDRLFPGMKIVASYPFRVTRNSDMELQEEEADDLLLMMEDNIRQRHFGSAVRLEIDGDMPADVRDILMSNLQVDSYDVYTTNGPLGLSSLWELHRLERPDLKDRPFSPRTPASLQNLGGSVFAVLRQRDLLLHHPYDSFTPVVNLLEAAADDPDVLAIKITLYRVGSNPPVVQALKKARLNNKQVAAVVELKARFDEETNIHWAQELESVGVHVAYGLIGLKTHCKVTLIIRRERDGIRRYVHLSSGNYNSATARLYTDTGFMSRDEDLAADAGDLFNFLTGYSRQEEYRKFLVAPVSIRRGLLDAIKRETALGPKGRIIIKCNSLVDGEMIRNLYRASQAGVKVDLIARGICCLRPGIPGVSDNIQVLSIIGRFLEHSRIYYFHNEGNPSLYMGSADLMPRNLDRRVEVLFPISDPEMQSHVVENILAVCLRDTAKSHILQSDGRYIPRRYLLDGDGPLFDSQAWFMSQGVTPDED